MKRIYLFFLLLGMVISGYTQKTVPEEIGKPNVLKTKDVCERLVANNYTSRISRNNTAGSWSSVPDKTAYAFMLDNNETIENMGFISFQMPKPDVYTILRDADMSNAIYTGVCVDEIYYAFFVSFSVSGFAFPTELATIDLETGEKKTVCSLSHLGDIAFNDMTYDYSTKTVYAIANTEGVFQTALFKFSLEDGSYEKMCVMDGTYMIAIACDYEGQMYGIGTGGGLYKINKNSGKIDLVGDTGYMPWFIQSMEFDHTDNSLYWAGADAEHTFLAKVDTETASTIEIGTFEPNSNITGLYIPFTLVKEGGPGKVTDLDIQAGQKGELNAKIKWNNPTTDPFGNILSETMGIKVYRDSELIANMTGRKPGEACELYDSEIIGRGNYTYRLVTYNEVSEGEAVKHTIWIGEDTPAQPENIQLTADDGKVNINWTVPEIGKNGGWVNHAKLQSKIYCVQDNRLVAETNDFNCVDENLESVRKWSYRIVVADEEGKSSEEVSDLIMAGPANEPPFFDDFQKTDFGDLWTVLNINNDTLFFRRSTSYFDKDNYYMEYYMSYLNAADEMAFAPPVKLYAGRDYKVSFDAKVRLMNYMRQEKIAVIITKSPDLQSEKDTIARFTMQDYETEWARKEFVFSPKNDGIYYAGIYLYSDANQNIVCIDNWKLEEYYYYDLQAVSISGSQSALSGIGSGYDVTVFNKGSKDISGYSLQIVDENGNPMNDEVKITETIQSGETRKHTLIWIPQEIKEQSLALSVKTETDGDLTNNTSPSITVNVQSSSEYEVKLGESWGTSNLPFAQDYEGPVNTQSIYTKKEINSINGLITDITWYTSGIEILPADMNIEVYLANTEKNDMSAGIIPVAEMTKVYEGEIQISSSSQREIPVELDKAFLYEGKNLAVHIKKISQGRDTYGWRNGFDFYKEEGNSQPTIFMNGVRDLVKDYKPVIKIRFFSSGNSVSGNVTDTEGQPIEGVKVTIPKLGLDTFTDTEGAYSFDFVTQGEYELNFEKIGYYNVTENIIVPQESENPTVKDIEMNKMPVCDFTFTIVNANNEPVVNAEIIIEGYDSRTATTDTEGQVTIEDWIREAYTITVNADDYQQFSTELDTKNTATATETYQLKPQPYPVLDLNVSKDNTVEWKEPVSLNQLRFDDGVITARAGHGKDAASEYGVFCIKIDEPGTVKKVRWYLYGEPGEKERNVILYIFYMGEDGYPESTPAYTKKGIVSTLNEWFEYKLDDGFKAERTFCVALSCPDDYLGLGVDSGSADGEYPWRNDCNFYTLDYRYSYYAAEIWYKGNFMIRLDMTELNPSVLQTYPLIENYNVYRFRTEDLENKDNWTRIHSSKETSYTDNEFSSLPQGYYMYAVTSQWKGIGESEAEYSHLIEKDMKTSVRINVSSNVDSGNVLDGTEIRLTSTDSEDIHSARLENGQTGYTFEDIRKGVYKLTIINHRFNTIEEEIRPETETEYTFGEYRLIENLVMPVNLLVEETEEKGVYALQWNRTSSYYEDFESHEDFALNSTGEIGWTYLDNDDNPSTYGLSYDNKKLEYDNWGARTAYIIFNPSATDPRSDTSAEISPWSGSKFLGSFSSSMGANDDLLISPELFFNEDFTLSFYAKSYTDMYGADRMMVGYSETDIELESFIWIQGGDFTALPSVWTQYSYTIPVSAKYVCIRCVSNNSFLFMVDDIQIGKTESEKYSTFAKSYEIYLDNNRIGTTESDTFEVKAGNGRHAIGVKAVYETGISEMSVVTVDNTETSVWSTEAPAVRYSDRMLLFDKLAEKITVYSVSGSIVKQFTDAENHVTLEDLSNGLYLANIVMGDEEYVIKFIIE